MKSHEHLLEEVSAELVLEGTTVGNIVEELSTKDWLHGDVGNWLLSAILSLLSGVQVA